jgi:Abscisic acid G-protein coupled receptor/The Golgi pH Regulator (GPHR) Family N-terminal
MDVVVLGAVVSFTTYLPRHLQQQAAVADPGGFRSLSTRAALGLSLSLFGISVLEVLPTTCLFWIENSVGMNRGGSNSRMIVKHGKAGDGAEPDRQYTATATGPGEFAWFRGDSLTVAALYRIVLWAMIALCLVVVPCIIGTHLLLKREGPGEVVDHEEQKKRSFTKSQNRGWSTRLATRVVGVSGRVLCRTLFYVVVVPSRRLARWSRGDHPTGGSTLPMVSSDRRDESLPPRSARQRFFQDPAFRKSAVLGSFVGTVLTCVLLSLISRLVIEPSVSALTSKSALLRAVSWLCAVGLLLSAVLNGFGSVSLPYSCLAGLFLQPIPRKAIANAESELEQTRVTLEEKVNEMRSTVGRGASGSPKVKSMWRNVRRNFSDLGDEVAQRRARLIASIDFLETLVDEMNEDIDEMRHAQFLSSNARSRIGVIFSVVLLLRLFAAMTSVSLQNSSGIRSHRSVDVDPVTQVLRWLLGHHVVQENNLQTLSQFISLLLTALLSFSQMRNCIRTITTVQRRVNNMYRRCYCKPGMCTRSGSDKLEDDNRTIQDKGWFISHLIAVLICCYAVACVVLTKMMLPFEYRSGFSAALRVSGVENEPFQIRTFPIDVAFAGMAILSAAVLAVTLGIMRANARRYAATDATARLLLMNAQSTMIQDVAEP